MTEAEDELDDEDELDEHEDENEDEERDDRDGETLAFDVGPDEAGQTVLAFLAERLPDVPTSSLRALVQCGAAELNERRCGPGQTLAAGDRLEVADEDLERIEPAPLEGFSILHEEEHLLACMKPAGVSVEAERGDDALPFKAAILHHLRATQGDGPVPRPRVVHRLDKDTTGVVLVAKTKHGLADLTRQLEQRTVKKDYLALVTGVVHRDAGEIDTPLEDPGAPASRRGPKTLLEAHTRWEVVERFHSHTLLRCHPLTGRQHQLRQHLASVGHPLAVDPLYGGATQLLLSKIKRGYRPPSKGDERPLLARLSLHAQRIVFASPSPERSGQPVEVVAPVPDDLEVALRQLRKWDTGGRQVRPGRGRRDQEG
jgi:23S rRNA pseudouridine1911/1915/1917 synthase